MALQDLKRSYRKDGARLSARAGGDKTTENGFNLKESTFRLDIRENYFLGLR